MLPHRSEIFFYVNGIKVVENKVDPEETLLYYLRKKLYLTGTKLGCGEGGCGACTVMISRYDHQQNKIIHYSINACLAPLCTMHGLAITTVEGIGNTKNGLHPVQERLAESHGSQCGFCTPGIVMSMYSLLRNNPSPSAAEMEHAFQGNLCRCTGYRPILQGFQTFTKEFCSLGENCCKNIQQIDKGHEIENGRENECHDVDPKHSAKSIGKKNLKPYNESQEPIFPPELQMRCDYMNQGLKFVGERVTWYRPSCLQELLLLKERHPDSRLVVGNTEIGIDMKLKNIVYPVLIDISTLPELLNCDETDTGLKIGASVTLSIMENKLSKAVKKLEDYKTRSYVAILEMLKWFASNQIRNVASIAGNIITASPISDLNPLLLAAGATLEVASIDGLRKVKMDEEFFTGYRTTKINKNEIVTSLFLPHTKQNEYIYGYKQAHRREDDIAIVNAGMRVLFEDKTQIIKDLALSFGGMAPTTVMARITMMEAVGKEWNEKSIEKLCETLVEDLPLVPGAPGGMVEYRRSLTLSFFFKFYVAVQLSYGKNNILPQFKTAASVFHKESSKSVQIFEEAPFTQSQTECLGRPIAHRSAHKHATGEAVYVDDIPPYENELYLAFVMSSKAKAKILKVDTSEALKMPGVVDYIDHNDVPGYNKWSDNEEEFFASNMVFSQGQVIGVIAADTRDHAKRAAGAVNITYEESEPVITIKEAIEKQSFHCGPLVAQIGNIQDGFSASDYIITGELYVGGQEHFYLETNVALAVPKHEDGEMEIFVGTQNPSQSQMDFASVLGIPANRISVRVKRIGGGFGAKETRSSMYACPLAVAAQKLKRPIRFMLDRDEDMASSGGRHPFLGKYKVGFSKEGKILAAEVDLYGNAGHSRDLSQNVYVMCEIVHSTIIRIFSQINQIVEHAMLFSENAYYIPNHVCRGYVCKTNIPSNTAFRGFGAPQAMLITEQWITEVALTLGMSQEHVKEINLFKDGNKTIHGQILENCNLQKCWDKCLKQCDLERQQEEVKKFNCENRWKKRGLSVVPTQFGIGIPELFLNQAGALVHVYIDGSVLLTHGGVEIGQGLHTKMMQVASKVLEIPISKIIISETSTVTVPNTTATCASVSSDLNGMAVLNACLVIKERLEPFKKGNPNGSWEQWIHAAYMDRVSLSSTGFYKTPGLSFDSATMKGNFLNYHTPGVACSQVEIDCLTGDHQVLKTDIVMDIGVSLNPAIDIGQIEGAFMQGYGMFCMEQPKVSPKGYVYTRGPGTYKIPSFGDIPVEFNVTLLKDSRNKKAVYSSKAIGEPPLFLAASVFFALKNAITSARMDEEIGGSFQLDSPATPERVRLCCKDRFTNKFSTPEEGSFTPWFVNP